MKLISFLLFLTFFLSCSSTPENKKTFNGLDCHMHAHPRGEGIYKGDRARFTLDSVGLSHGCVLSQGYQGPYGEEKKKFKSLRQFVVSRNDWTLKESKENKGLLPFCSVPVKAHWAVEEVKRCIKLDSVGLKLHLASEKVSLLDTSIKTSLDNIFSTVTDKLVVLIHINHNDKREVQSFYDIVKKHPSTKVIVAHNLGRNYSMLVDAPKNLYTEISSLVMWPIDMGTSIVDVWRKFGIDRVLLGSDWPVFHPAGHLHVLKSYPLNEKERQMIIRDNASVLFRKFLR